MGFQIGVEQTTAHQRQGGLYQTVLNHPYRPEMYWCPVSRALNNVRNEGSELIRPAAIDGEPELVVREGERGERGSAVNFRAEHGGDIGGQGGEKGEAGVLLNLQRVGDVGVPVAAQSVRHVRDGNGDDARGRGDAAQSSSASERSTDDDFPDVRTDIRLAAGNLGRAETARPAD